MRKNPRGGSNNLFPLPNGKGQCREQASKKNREEQAAKPDRSDEDNQRTCPKRHDDPKRTVDSVVPFWLIHGVVAISVTLSPKPAYPLKTRATQVLSIKSISNNYPARTRTWNEGAKIPSVANYTTG